jgi:uncharacterized protein YcfJ
VSTRGTFMILLLTIASLMSNARAQGFRSYATVINVQPITETTYTEVRRQVCNEPDNSAHLSTPLATTIGEDIRQLKRAWQAQTSCTTVTDRQPNNRVTAYQVTYRYRGYTKTTRLSYHPGERLAVNVSLSPVP